MKRAPLIGILAVLVAAAGLCAYRYYDTAVLPEKRLDEADAQQLALFESIRPASADANGTPLEAAQAVNASVTAWLTIPDTHIDYPIAQAEDNDFYLHHGFDGALNQELGCPFLDYRCERDFSGFNSIVYAHHMTRQRMFADIALFKDESFLQSHPEGTLTLPDGTHTVRFYAYLTVPSTAPAYHTVFVTDVQRREYLDYIASAASVLQPTGPDESSRLLLLSTCTFEYEEARGVLVGVIE
ncbi:MAG: class B sortase [Oscillospiraceae bacterium]|nr:class B sortase [Oscillospiraceae bacterium]